MDIKRATARPTKIAAEDKFIGRVWQDEVLNGEATSRLRTTNVSLSPGGGTTWRSHPVGQTLYCVSGIERVQLEEGKVQEFHPGDTAMILPDTRHGHSAVPDRILVHLAMFEVNEKRVGTACFKKVSGEDYTKPLALIE